MTKNIFICIDDSVYLSIYIFKNAYVGVYTNSYTCRLHTCEYLLTICLNIYTHLQTIFNIDPNIVQYIYR